MLGDRWTMLVVRELVTGPKRTMELLSNLYPISSRTLVGRLRDMERDLFLQRTDFGGNPPHIEYELTERGRLLLPLLEALRKLGETLGCNSCEDRMSRAGGYCESCPLGAGSVDDGEFGKRTATRPRNPDESIVLL